MQFDSEKIIQFLSRVRTENNNLTVLLGSTDKEIGKISNMDFFYNRYEKLTNLKAYDFNNYYFNKFGLDAKSDKITKDWESFKRNESYKDIKDLVYMDNGLLRVDLSSIWNKARLEHGKDNYYNDKFILNELKQVKARFINDIVVIAPITVEKESKIKEDSTIKEDLSVILNDSKSLMQLLKLVKKDISSKELDLDFLKDFYKKYSQNKLFKELLSILRATLKLPSNSEDISEVTIFINILTEYTKEQSKKDRIQNIENIKRVEVYNKLFPIGTEMDSIKNTGDILYYVVRKNFDCYLVNQNIISNRAYDWAINDTFNLRGYYWGKDKKGNKTWMHKGKKINQSDVIAEIEKCVNEIYDITNKKYIYKLK